jgi:hypothetical protein
MMQFRKTNHRMQLIPNKSGSRRHHLRLVDFCTNHALTETLSIDVQERESSVFLKAITG